MTVTVLCFARLKELVGSGRVTLELPADASVKDLRRELFQQFPAVESLAGQLLVAVNGEYAGDDAAIPAGAEVACFPPVSGG